MHRMYDFNFLFFIRVLINAVHLFRFESRHHVIKYIIRSFSLALMVFIKNKIKFAMNPDFMSPICHNARLLSGTNNQVN